MSRSIAWHHRRPGRRYCCEPRLGCKVRCLRYLRHRFTWSLIERIFSEVDRATDEIVQFTADLVRIPTVNPPGRGIRRVRAVSRRLASPVRASTSSTSRPRGDPSTPPATRASTSSDRGAARRRTGRPPERPHRRRAGRRRLDGRTVRRAGARRPDLRARRLRHESRHRRRGLCRRGDRARRHRAARHDRDQRHRGRGERRLCRRGAIWPSAVGSRRARTDFVIIPEPLNVDRICIGHRGVYWFEVTARGRIGARQHAVSRRQRHRRHGPAAAVGARGADAGAGVAAHRRARWCRRARATPPSTSTGSTAASRSTASRRRASPTAAARCSIGGSCIEEGFDATRARNRALLVERGRARMPRRPLRGARPDDRPPDAHAGRLAGDRGARARHPDGCSAARRALIASPGTYDHKHVARIAGVPHCVAYGPGELELAHQPDEYCRIDDLVNATKVLALATLDLMGVGDRLKITWT